MNSYNLPGYGDICLCGSDGPCRCLPDPDPEVLYQEAYERGYDACLSDGPDNHPLACWPGDPVSAAVARDWRRLASGQSIVGIDGRRFYGSHWFNAPRAWSLRGLYGLDPFHREPYPADFLAGFEDAMAGLPSAVTDPERHRVCAAALAVYEPAPAFYDRTIGPVSAPTEVDSDLPF